MKRATWIGAVLGLVALGVSGRAQADEPRTAGVVQLGVGFRYGFGLNDADLNPWASGLGLDGGYTLSNALYLGGSFEYFFGSRDESPLVSTEGKVLQLSGEAGYDIGLGEHVVLRPKAGLGLAHFSGEACIEGLACSSSSEDDFLLAPGLTAMFFAKSFMLSIDTRLALAFSDPTSKGLILSVGVGF